MNEQGKRLQRKKQEDAAFHKLLIWLAGAVVVEGLSLLLRRLYLNFSYSDLGIGIAEGMSNFFRVFSILGLVLTVAGCVWVYLTVKKQGKRIVPLAVTGAVLWLWIASVLCYWWNPTGVGVLCVLPAVVAGLAAIFFLYQREFFVEAVLGAVGIFALWVYRQIYMNHPRMTYCGFAAVVALMALCAFGAYMLSKREGKLSNVRVLAAGASYLTIYLTCAVVALTLVAALLLGVASAYYVIIALVAWLFCLAVYHTVKLM